ncbi:RecF/RecN/SMC [Emericellopsis atlantica]|uniref:Structural maintenance of chromosomes protein n=1 Tax=Emericellopsis atlantica TaxID=2614577 RepID=A0A9P7ZEK5_9HYPO|nr:RecF/RecN/SMC [Emericellopsis atlantica]KAG9250372.1 RecF/RecN/SMC [Emericellopsis atlantica]
MGKLIRLELFNFKSYKGHHTLLFGDSYFTSIIGPNGSGKSNSMDAISFVLGIKSSHLRSAHLKDLVYRGRVLQTSKINDDGSVDANGSSNGVPNGSQQAARGDPKTAWVMAVYEDDAGDEQRWKRSITSSGASEYRINDRVVTAQQYNEGLEAENILIKARNFLVFQGDVEAIASQSPQDLTRLVEQISGSLEYKADYERLQAEAEQAAENQNFQLQRRRGINSEIKQYREQKKEADNFQKKADEKDNAIVTHTLWKLYHFQKAMDDSKAAIHSHHEDLKDLRRNVETFQKKLDVARENQSNAARQVSKIEKNIKGIERGIEDAQDSMIPHDEKIAETNRRLEVNKSKTDRITRERDEQAATIAKLQKDVENVVKAEARFEKEIKDQMRQQGRDISDADRKEYDALRSQVMLKTTADQKGLAQYERTEKADEVTYRNLESKVDYYTRLIERNEADLAQIAERKKSTEAIARELTSSVSSMKKEFHRLQAKRIESSQKRTVLEERLEDVSRKLKDADDGRRQSDRERRLKDMIATLKSAYPGVHGRVGDLCKPKQNKFEEAVLVALGRNFDSVVVDTEKVGTDCIAYLREQRFPTMSFIPLDNIKIPQLNTSIKGIKGARLAVDTVNFDSAFERAIIYACGNSVVCDTIEVAKHICFEKKFPVEAVTLDGFVIHEGGTMTGGRGPDSKGKRRFEPADIPNLERSAKNLKEEIENLPKADRHGSKEEALESELAVLERRLKVVSDEVDGFTKNYESKHSEVKSLKKELRAIQPKFDQKKAELESVRANVQRFKTAISQVEDEVFASFCSRLGYSDIRAYEASQGKFEQEANQKRQEYSVQKQKLHNRLNWEIENHKQTEARLKTTRDNIRKLVNDIKAFEEEKSRLQSKVLEMQAELEALRELLDEHKSELTERSEKVSEAKAELQKRSKGIESRQKEITELENIALKNSSSKSTLLRRCRLEQIQVPLVEGSLDDLPLEDETMHGDIDGMDLDEDQESTDDIARHHGVEIDYSSLDPEYRESGDEEVEAQLQQHISSLTSELEKLNPNMRAMERLEGVETRLKQTDEEYEDSKIAAHNAKEAFREIKEKRYELFNKAFSHIQDQIKVVYRDLTRSEAYPLGGQAYLDIEEDTDMPYLSGIKYHAMPPLKRFRDMEHLSGGEKTMAALALLFAVHSYQSSPFFVLDEVDAALDNANVDKIKKYIRDHAGPGMQFVVISLKAGLFQDSESLVGVYRDQEVNSSRTLTLDLRKYA